MMMLALQSRTSDSVHSKVNHRRRLALLLLGSFFATQAAQHPRHLFHRHFRRLLPQRHHHNQQALHQYEYSYDVEELRLVQKGEGDDGEICLDPATADTRSASCTRAVSTTGCSSVQSMVERSLTDSTEAQNAAAAALSYRGGYKDEVAVETDADAVTVVVDKIAADAASARIDLQAKAKEYGELEFSLFQKGDGSDEDPEGIPDRYLRMQLQNREKAKKACQLTLEWREENGIDHILRDPHPDFDICKAVFPHYFTSRDKDGHIVFLQRPALLNLELAAKNGLDKEHLLSTC